MSAEFESRDATTQGRKCRLVCGSIQTTSFKPDFPNTMSIKPSVASGASDLVRLGLRISPSTRMVREPLCAATCAKASLTVDLPSFGRAEVIPITLFEVPKWPRSVGQIDGSNPFGEARERRIDDRTRDTAFGRKDAIIMSLRVTEAQIHFLER